MTNYWKKCAKCGQNIPAMSLFLCKGRMVCEGCFRTDTDGNMKYINEEKYPRKNIY